MKSNGKKYQQNQWCKIIFTEHPEKDFQVLF
jgi:hypothetical protein